MYKAADIARAKANIGRHEWAAQLYGRMKSWTKVYDGMSRERQRSFIGERTPYVTAQIRFGPMRLEGRAAVARLRGQKLDTLYLAEGTLAECDGLRLSLDTIGDAFGERARGILNRAQTTNGR